MISQDLKDKIDSIEQCVDEARRAVQAGRAPDAVRQAIEALHTQARNAKQKASSIADDNGMRDTVLQLEHLADRAMATFRSLGNLDPQTQQAIQRAHDEASKLKKQIEAGTAA